VSKPMGCLLYLMKVILAVNRAEIITYGINSDLIT